MALDRAREANPSCRHHPPEELLLTYAAGTLDEGASLIVATHLTYCRACRASVRAAEAIGGLLLDGIQPSPLQGNAGDAFVRLTEPLPPAAETTSRGHMFPKTLDHYLPQQLARLKWRWVGPGMKLTLIMRDEEGTRIDLVRLAPDARIPRHSHNAEEMTMVLAGGFTDGRQSYQPGDVQYVAENTEHGPIADAEGCTALVLGRGKVRVNSIFLRLIQILLRI